MAQRLLGNVQVDSSKAQELLGCGCSYFAPFCFEAGVAELFAKQARDNRITKVKTLYIITFVQPGVKAVKANKP